MSSSVYMKGMERIGAPFYGEDFFSDFAALKISKKNSRKMNF